jgi:enamine deaminase RidA (YjgF/YER057c/UK114 family)
MAIQKTFYNPKSHDWFQGFPASSAVRAGDLLFISGQVAAAADGSIVAPGDSRGQAAHAFEGIQALVEEAGGTMDDVVDLISFHKDIRDLGAVAEVAAKYLPSDAPAWTAIGSQGTYEPEQLINIKAIAHLGDGEKTCYNPDRLEFFRAFPMSAGCRKGDLLFISGCVGADAKGNVLDHGDHAAQVVHAFDGLRSVLDMAGGSLDDIVDLHSFHVDPRGMDLAAEPVCNRPDIFGDTPVAYAAPWTAIGTTGLAMPGLLGEYRVIADLGSGQRIASTPDTIWWRELPVSGGSMKKGGSLIGVAGQVASHGDGTIVGAGDVAAQTSYDFDQIELILDGFGAGLSDVVEIISFHKDPRAIPEVMAAARGRFAAGAGPAWTATGTTGLWQEGYLHEIHALAVV